MRRVPIHILFAIAGLLLISVSVLTLLAADPQQSTHPIAPTAIALLTQMPPEAVFGQLAAMGYPISPEMQATALAMLQQMPPEAVFDLLLVNAGNVDNQPAPVLPSATSIIMETAVILPTEVVPVQPTLAPTLPPTLEPAQPLPESTALPTVELTAPVLPEQTQPPPEATAAVFGEELPQSTLEAMPGVVPATLQPPVLDAGQPRLNAGGQQMLGQQPPLTPVVDGPPGHQPPQQPGQPVLPPEATAELGSPPTVATALQATVMPTTEPVQSPVPVGRISGSVRHADAEATGTALVLTRPDGTTLNLPASADGSFAFSNMEPGAYSLLASATGYLSGQASFVLEAGQDLVLPTVTLLPGDTNGDNRIDLTDAVLLAANFDAPPPVPAADLNRDGWIDVRDLALLGNAFGLSGPLPWG
ncbi:MAG: carboxypeptidase regulatory-like domain-containing protein [Chloroflexi bacterium]|nr:carboxypeptidase regulatory-like domain-containing protein [Chloroflexota bacterium]